MSQIPGFSLNSMGAPSNQPPQQSMPPNMIFSQPHQLLPQHQQQRAPQNPSSQPQGVPGVSDPEHQRFWHAIDQQVRANPSDPTQTNFNQMAQYFRNPSMHSQQGNLQGFQPHMQSHNVNANQVHHPMNPNTNPQQFNNMGGQLQSLEHNPVLRQFLQQQQQLRQQQVQQQQQQHQTTGNISSPYPVDFGFGSSPSHPLNSNPSATIAADLARQYNLMTRAGQNQGQNGNSINLSQGNAPVNRTGQVQGLPNQSNMAQQGLSFQQATHAANMQLNAVPHQSHVSHQNASGAQQAQLTRQMYTGGTSVVNPGGNGNSSVVGSNTVPSANNGSINTLPGRVPASGSIQLGAADLAAINSRRRVELQLAALQQDILKTHKMLSDIGWFPGTTAMTDQQRQLATEYEQKKSLYDRYRSYMAQVPQVNMPVNGQAISNPATGNPMVHGWPGQVGKPNGPPGVNVQQATPRISSGGPQQGSMQGPPSSPFPQQQPTIQQPQSIFTPMQQQQTLPVPRAPSAQSMNPAMQQVQQQQQQRAQTGSVSGSMFDSQGQAVGGAGLRPPTVPPQPGTAAVTAQSNRTTNRTPMQGQGQALIPQGTQGIPSNVTVHPRPSPTGVDPNADKAAFDTNLKVVLDRQNITIDSRDLVIDTQEVQLHQLFSEVMERGANAAVTQNNAWAVIGASLGFVQFPANGGEPARSSTHIAVHLQHLYQKYLFPYEQMYLTRLSQEKRRLLMQAQPSQNSLQLSQQQQQQLQHLQQQQLAAQQHPGQRQPNGGGFSFMQNPAMVMQAQQQQNAETQRQLQQATHNLPPQQQIQASVQATHPGQAASHLNMRANAYVQFANVPVTELRKLGVPENNIAIIEQNRLALRKQFEQQQQMLQAMQQQRGQGHIQQNQISQQMNAAMSQMPGVRSNIPGSAGGPREAPQMHAGNVAQVSQHPQHFQNHNTQHQIPTQAQNDISPVYTRPTQELMSSATEFIHQAVTEHTAKLKRGFSLHPLRDADRPVYAHIFNQFMELVTDMEKKLAMFHALFQDVPSTQKLIVIITTAKEQKRLVASGSNQYILSLPMVHTFMTELRTLADNFQKAIATISPSPTQFPPGQPPNHPSNPNQPSVMLPQPSGNDAVNLSQAPQNTPPQQTHVDAVRAQPAQQQFQQGLQVPVQTQPISKSKRPGTTGVANTPSPAAPTTPFMNAPTPPTTSSPRTPKSPPKKPSNAATPAPNSAPAPAPKSKPIAMNRRPSKAGQIPSTKAGIKRPREEEVPVPPEIHPEPKAEPIAKKPKREDWDGPPNDEVEKRRQELDRLETNQDVQNFLARTADDLLVGGAVQIGDNSAENPGEDIPNALQDFLRSAPLFGITESFHVPQIYGDPMKLGDFSPNGEHDNLFESFLDLSKCAQDEPIPSSSKLDPPDLVHSSANPSTNPSPESAAETPKYENAVISGKIKENAIKIVDDFHMHNPLDHNLWSELNNGEPAYYEQTNFKYDGELPAQDSPWAISSGGT
ncbi:hypothetical protein Clacol_002668 [Clathrus columnatus]|uniref:ARID domain-containing protein n=1 Tax=Clathrus columnatus TaxID=1419009 RepID=A0AAV5A663_9AGAM|nr:hypothetical protein Clacol_002668 [Clathrus columnatus]